MTRLISTSFVANAFLILLGCNMLAEVQGIQLGTAAVESHLVSESKILTIWVCTHDARFGGEIFSQQHYFNEFLDEQYGVDSPFNSWYSDGGFRRLEEIKMKIPAVEAPALAGMVINWLVGDYQVDKQANNSKSTSTPDYVFDCEFDWNSHTSRFSDIKQDVIREAMLKRQLIEVLDLMSQGWSMALCDETDQKIQLEKDENHKITETSIVFPQKRRVGITKAPLKDQVEKLRSRIEGKKTSQTGVQVNQEVQKLVQPTKPQLRDPKCIGSKEAKWDSWCGGCCHAQSMGAPCDPVHGQKKVEDELVRDL